MLQVGTECSEPPNTSTNLATVDVLGDGSDDLVYHLSVVTGGQTWVIAASVVPMSHTHVLAGSATDPYFSPGAEISMQSVPYANPLDGLNRLPISGYRARLDKETLTWYFYGLGNEVGAGDRGEVLVGLRLHLEEVDHYGWVRFARPDAKSETLFQVAGHDWNPVPGAPIRAGLPPEIPIASEILPEGAGIRLTWPGGISHWILESTASLSPPILWEVYPASGGSYADVPAEDADRFFRLRRPD